MSFHHVSAVSLSAKLRVFTLLSVLCRDRYQWGEQQPNFVNPMWVGVGLWTNTFSLIISWFVSCIIIYTSGDILEMVLNSVAVTFMMTLDDEIVLDQDYRNLRTLDGADNSFCQSINSVYAKIGGLLLKIHPLWEKRVNCNTFTATFCDILLCPFMIVIPLIVLFCFPGEDVICLYEDAENYCVS